MPLQKQTIDFQFTGDLDEKTAAKVLPNGRLAVMENANLDKVGKLQKRLGHNALANTIASGGSMAACKRLGAYGKNLVATDGSRLYSKAGDASSGLWLDKGSLETSRLTTTPIVGQNTASDLHVTIGCANGYYVVLSYVQLDLTGAVPAGGAEYRYHIIEAATGAAVVSDQALDATAVHLLGLRPVAVSMNSLDKVYIIYFDSAFDMRLAEFDLTDPTAAPTLRTILTNPIVPVYGFDAIPDPRDNGYFYVSYWGVSSGNRLLLASFDSAFVNWATSSFTGMTLFTGAIGSCMSSNNHLWVFFEDSGTLYVCSKDFTNPKGPTGGIAVTSVEAGFVTRDIVAITASPTASNTVRVFYEIMTGAALNNEVYIRKADVSTVPAVTGVADFLRSVGIKSRAWSRSNVPYLAVGHTSAANATPTSEGAYQGTTFIANSSGDILGRCLIARGGGTSSRVYSGFSDVVSPSSDVFVLAATRLGQALQDYVERSDIVSIESDFNKAGNMVEFGEQLFSPQGHLYSYDGETVCEHGFHLYPHGTKNVGETTGGSLTATGTYYVAFTYEWFDNKGQWHRSAPSAPHSFTLTGANNKYQIQVPTLRLTGKSNVLIGVYRTVDAATTPYYFEAFYNNDPTVDYVTVTLTMSDANISDERTLYTDSGELDHIAPAPALTAVPYASRLFLLGTDGKIYHSKLRQSELGIAFNDGLYIVPDAGDGKPRGIASQDGQLIIGTDKRLLHLYGEGPNDLGIGAFQDPLTLASDVGVADNNSMLTFSGGTLIPSSKGLWLLGRGLSLEHIGDVLQDSLSGDLIAAALHPTRNDLVLVYDPPGANPLNLQILDLDRKQWKVDTIIGSGGAYIEDVVSCNKLFYIGMSDGTVYESQSTNYYDPSLNYNMKIKTGDIRLAGLTGYERLWEIRVLADFKGPNYLYVKIYHSDGTTEEKNKGFVGAVYPYVFRFQPAKQATGAFAVEVWEVAISGTRQSLDLYGLSFDVGIRSKRPVEPNRTL